MPAIAYTSRMHRFVLALLFLASAPRAEAIDVDAPSAKVDGLDAFFATCVAAGNRGDILATAARLGHPSEASRHRQVFALGAPAATLTVYWDTTCRVDLPAAADAALLARFDAQVAKQSRRAAPGPDREPLPGMKIVRNVVLQPTEYEPPLHLVVLTDSAAPAGAHAAIVATIQPPPPPPAPPGYPQLAPMPLPKLDPGPNQVPELDPGMEPGAVLAPPRYTRAMIKACTHGKVMLRISIDASGRPRAIEPFATSGVPDLDASAIEAARKWKFRPGRLNGEPVGGDVIVPVNFPDPCK